MGKRKGRAAEPSSRTPRHRRQAVLVFLAVAAVGLLWAGQAAWQSARDRPVQPAGGHLTAAARREARPTLDPALFVGKARLAHRVARTIPEVLDALYCYCYCDKHLGHKSLLSCYTDGHAAT